MIKNLSAIELNLFQGKTPARCGAKCFIKHPENDEFYCFHRHNFIEFEYIESGTVENEICGTEFTLGAGDFYALGTDDFHKVRIKEKTEIYTLTLYTRLLPSPLQKLMSKFTLPIVGNIPEGKREEMALWLSKIRYLLFHDEPACEEKSLGYLLLFLSTALEYSTPVVKKQPKGHYKHIASATEYIQSHYKEDISLEDIARAVYLSPNHLSKLFSEANRMSISQYLTEYRLEMARYYLISTEKSITDIAMECGFGSFSSFSRSWKRYYGMNPREYKKLLNKEEQR